MNNITKGLFLFFVLAVLSVPMAENLEVGDLRSREITVEVKGEVDNPGFYSLPAYSNVADLLEITELSENADVSKLNAGVILKDNDVIIIPDREQEASKISINTGTREQLDTIPGIGPVTAENIIIYRSENGFFQSLDDLVRVKGIGEKTLRKIREFICL